MSPSSPSCVPCSPICRLDGRLQQRSASHFTRNKFRCHFLSSPLSPSRSPRRPVALSAVRLPLFLVICLARRIAMAMSVNGVTYMNSRQLCIFKFKRPDQSQRTRHKKRSFPILSYCSTHSQIIILCISENTKRVVKLKESELLTIFLIAITESF